MRGFDRATILSPSFHGLRKERLVQWPLICVQKYNKNARGGGRGVLPEKLGGGVRHAPWNPYPISDQNLWFSLPYFTPKALEPGASTSSPGRFSLAQSQGKAPWGRGCPASDKLLRHVHGWRNIKREMVLSPNDEEVASSKKDTQFKTRVPINHTLFHTKAAKKNIPFGAALTFIAYIREYPSGAKNALQIISLAAYASETNNKGLKLRTFYCLLFNGSESNAQNKLIFPLLRVYNTPCRKNRKY